MKEVRIRGDQDVYNVKTGCVEHYPDIDDQDKYYTFLVKCGHCDPGYFIPVFLTIATKNKDYAIELAKNVGRVKRSNKHCIIGMKEVSREQFFLLMHINDCDEYLKSEDSKTVEDIYERRVVMEEAVMDLNNYGKNKRLFNLDRLDIKTRDEYDEKYVLQRYLAPYYVGKEEKKLMFPRKLRMGQVLDEYFYYNVLELGIGHGKVNALAMYYQIYGKDNPLGIEYKNGYMVYKNLNGEQKRAKIPDTMHKYMDNLTIDHQKKQSNACDEIISIPTAREKFERRYNISIDDESEKQ